MDVPFSETSYKNLIKKLQDKQIDPASIFSPPPLVYTSDVETDNQTERLDTILLRKLFKFQDLTADIVKSYDVWVEDILPRQLYSKKIEIEANKEYIVFKDLKYKLPFRYDENRREVKLYPMYARERETYQASLFAKLVRVIPKMDKDGNEILVEDETSAVDIFIGKIPVMLGSVLCNLRGMDEDELMKHGEEPLSAKGYFIIKGGKGTTERIIVMMDCLRANVPFVFIDPDKGRICRAMFKSSIMTTSLTELIMRPIGSSKGYSEANLSCNVMRVYISEFPLPTINNCQGKTSSHIFNVLQIFRLLGYPELDDMLKFILVFIKPEWRKLAMKTFQMTIEDYLSISDDGEDIKSIAANSPEGLEIFITMNAIEAKEKVITSLKKQFMPHMNTETIENKLYLFGYMISKYLLFLTGSIPIDNRDSWANKSVKTPGKTLEKLLNPILKKIFANIKKDIINNPRIDWTPETVSKRYKNRFFTEDILTAFRTGKWGVPGMSSVDDNQTEILERLSLIQAISFINKISSKVQARSTNVQLRKIHASQYGYIDIFDTPEGQKIGINKHKTITAFITYNKPDAMLLRILKNSKLLIEKKRDNSPFAQNDCVLLNGKLIGWGNGLEIISYLKTLRRKMLIDFDTMLVYDKDFNMVLVSNDEGRLVRPLLIVNEKTQNLVIEEKNLWGEPFEELLKNGAVEYIDSNEQMYIKLCTSMEVLDFEKKEFKNLIDRKAEIESTLKSEKFEQKTGTDDTEHPKISEIKRKLAELNTIRRTLVEQNLDFSDTKERENRYNKSIEIRNQEEKLNDELRLVKDEIFEKKKLLPIGSLSKEDALKHLDNVNTSIYRYENRTPYSHCELSPDSIMSFSTAILPVANYSKGSRTAYQTNMSKSAIGIFHSNFMERFDKTSRVLIWPSKPLFRTHIEDIIGLSDKPSGEQVIVAITTYEGMNVEDALVFNKTSVERGLFTSIIYHVFSETLKPSSDTYTEEFARPIQKSGKKKNSIDHLDENGIAKIDTYLKKGDIVINKKRTFYDDRIEDVPVYVGAHEEGVVERILMDINSDSETIVKVKIRQISQPVEGDKFVMRYGQKGIVSVLVDEKDLPYIEGTNIRPDIIFNPHGIPSRLTMGVMIEILMSKYTALSGEEIDASSFQKVDIDKAIDYLRARGMDPYGRERLIDPKTGKRIENLILMGPVYYQAMKHQSRQKIQGRLDGPKKLFTRQPTRASASVKESGLTIGEGERSALISHGSGEVLADKMCYASDAFETPVCTNCGEIATVIAEREEIKCNLCGDDALFGKITIPYPYKTLVQLLHGAGVDLRLNFTDTDDVEQYLENNDIDEDI